MAGGAASLIRAATTADAVAVAAIYAHHVTHGTATFDLAAPAVADWQKRIAAIVARGWPFLVADAGGVVTGYGYATQFRDRPAYARTCENSIYVAPEQVGRGVGGALVTALIDASVAAGFAEMIAVISGGAPSLALHERAGFRQAGRLENVWQKFGRLLDTVYMQRSLTAGAGG